MNKKSAIVILKISVSALILYFLAKNIELTKLKVIWDKLSIELIALLLFIAFMSQLVSSIRWYTILKDDFDVKYNRIFSFYFIGMFFNNFLPTMIGGDAVKGYYVYKETGSGAHSVSSIFLDRYSGFAVLMAITFGSVVITYDFLRQTELPFLFFSLIGAFVVMSLIIWVNVFHRWAVDMLLKIHLYKLNEKVDSLYNALMAYKGRKPVLLKIFVISIFVQMIAITGYYILGNAIGIDLAITYYYLFIPMTAAAAMIPLSFAGIGIREGFFVLLFTKAGVGVEEALSLSIFWFFVMLIVSLTGLVEYLRLGGREMLEEVKTVSKR